MCRCFTSLKVCMLIKMYPSATLKECLIFLCRIFMERSAKPDCGHIIFSLPNRRLRLILIAVFAWGKAVSFANPDGWNLVVPAWSTTTYLKQVKLIQMNIMVLLLAGESNART